MKTRKEKLLDKTIKVDAVKAEKLWFDGLIDREIAEKLGCSKQQIWKWRNDNKLPSNRNLFDWNKDAAKV